jgi:hypothetical protein
VGGVRVDVVVDNRNSVQTSNNQIGNEAYEKVRAMQEKAELQNSNTAEDQNETKPKNKKRFENLYDW